jgi:Protein of unknown function (DUF3631)
MSSADLVAALVAIADKPWGECNHGKALTQNGLARRLKDFGIKPKHVGPKINRVNGYEVKAFKDAFSRYLSNPPFPSSHPHTTNEINVLCENQTSHQKIGCEDENYANLLKSKKVYRCEVENPENSARDENGMDGTATTGGKKVTDRSCETAMRPAGDDWGLDE